MARTWKMALTDVDLDDREIEAVANVLRSKWLSMGELTKEFECRFGRYVGTSHAIAVTNCTAALQLAYASLGLGPGDEIIMPALTFVATANAALAVGATPVFADVTSEDDLTLSPTDIARKITRRTRAIAVVHYAGYPCAMEQIMSTAREHGLAVIEDCAHSVGAHYHGRHTGAIGDVGCFSFFANKNMTTGEGGMITTSRDDLERRLRLLRSHGMTAGTLDRRDGTTLTYDVVCAGYNFRMDELRAALGLVQLAKLEGLNRRRAVVVDWYRQELRGQADISVPFATRTDSSFHLMPVLLRQGVHRAAVMTHMHDAGIQTSIHYPPIHRLTHYRRAGWTGDDLDVTNSIHDRLLTLPLSPAMSRDDVQEVVRTLHAAIACSDGGTVPQSVRSCSSALEANGCGSERRA